MVLSCSASALADDAQKWSGSVAGQTSFVSGPTGEAFNPSLGIGLRLGAGLQVSENLSASASWGVDRNQTFGRSLATSTGHILDSSDLRVSVARAWTGDEASLVGRIDTALPASRNGFVCNPFFGALGAGVMGAHNVGEGRISLDLSGSRSFFQYASAPVGHCGYPLTDYAGTQTLTGTVEPESGVRFGAPNAAWSGATTFAISDPHAWLFRGVPKLSTTVSVGTHLQRRRVDGAAIVNTLTGPVVVPSSAAPTAVSFPVSVGGGWALSERVEWGLTFANTVPSILDDPGAFYRNIPARTAVRTSLTGRW